MNRLIRQAIRSWISWKSKRRFFRKYPEINLLDQEERELKRQHKPTRYVRAAKKAFVTAALRGEVR